MQVKTQNHCPLSRSWKKKVLSELPAKLSSLMKYMFWNLKSGFLRHKRIVELAAKAYCAFSLSQFLQGFVLLGSCSAAQLFIEKTALLWRSQLHCHAVVHASEAQIF